MADDINLKHVETIKSVEFDFAEFYCDVKIRLDCSKYVSIDDSIVFAVCRECLITLAKGDSSKRDKKIIMVDSLEQALLFYENWSVESVKLFIKSPQ